MKKQLILSAAISVVISNLAWADSDEFTLGKITVSGDATTQKIEATTINAEEMQDQGLVDVGQSLQRVPGVVLDMGGRRAETKPQIRGFDSTRVTLNIDGIPVYMPYDGNIDLSRYLTGELSKIEVQKSLGSLMLGANNMGGSINLVSRKPTKDIEGRITAGIETGKSGIFSNFQNLSLGSNLDDRFYIQASMSKVDSGDYPMSSKYKPNVAGAHPKGDRIHSGNQNTTQSFKFGYTPNETDEYAVGYHSISGSKQAPWNADPDDDFQRYWDWPVWDKESIYFLSNTQLGDAYLKTRIYRDTFQNELKSYNDENYNNITKGYAFNSTYDDEAIGANFELGQDFGRHKVTGIFHAKIDEHTERDLPKSNGTGASDWEIYKTEIFSLGAEDRWQLTDDTAVTLGYRLDQHQVTKAVTPDDSPTSDKDRKSNFQLKAEHKLENHTLFGGVSVKSRYASPKEKISKRMGRYVPNNNLKAEQATHFELGSLGRLGNIEYQANVFYSEVDDAIEAVEVLPTNQCNDPKDNQCFQNQNVGESKHYGAELAGSIVLADELRLDASYSYLEKKLKDSSLKATNSPKHQALITMNYYPTASLDLAADLQLASDRYMKTNGSEKVSGYGLVNLRGSYQVNNIRVNVALKNAMDKNYQLSDGDPRPGRTLWTSLTANF